MCNTAPSPFSFCFSEIISSLLSSNLRGLRLEVGLKLKDVGIDGDGKSDTIEYPSVLCRIKDRQVHSLVSLSVSHQGEP